MEFSCFNDKAGPPDQAALAVALGKVQPLWESITHLIREQRPGVEFVWKMAAPKYGWSLRAMDGKRNLLYMIPQRGAMLAAVVLGDRAVAAAQDYGLPEQVLSALNSATRYAEGTGIRLPVSKKADLAWVRQLIELKLM